jgi:hypothetical protein
MKTIRKWQAVSLLLIKNSFNMKKIKLLTIPLLLSVFAFSQDYYPLVQESNEWNVLRVILEGGNVWDTTYYTQTYKISGDTLISEQAYKKVFKSEEEIPVNWEYEGAIREAEQKVWYFPYYGNGETKIYDFTASNKKKWEPSFLINAKLI